MNRDEMKRLLPIITAFTEGKKIEWKNGGGQWELFEDGIFADNVENFRIKPESQLVPFTFEDAEFLIGKVLKTKKGTTKSPAFTLVTSAGDRGVALGGSSDKAIPYDALFQQCTFLDGSPCGKLVETIKT